jgi:hypothetical protein
MWPAPPRRLAQKGDARTVAGSRGRHHGAAVSSRRPPAAGACWTLVRRFLSEGGGIGCLGEQGGRAAEDTYYYNCNRQILQFSELWHFLFVTSRLVTANASPQLYGEILCQQRLTNIQYSRYVYGTPNLPPFCLADSPNLAKSCSLTILTIQL